MKGWISLTEGVETTWVRATAVALVRVSPVGGPTAGKTEVWVQGLSGGAHSIVVEESQAHVMDILRKSGG
jgi:hypothetical protein